MESVELDDAYYISVLGEKSFALLKELETNASTQEARERVAALKRSFSPEARTAEAQRRERGNKQCEEQNRGFPHGRTFRDIEIA